MPSATRPSLHAFIYKHLTKLQDLKFDFLILQFDTVCVKDKIAAPKARWLKTPFANLVRYVPSGIYFSRIRVRGKLIRRSLKTNKLAVAKLRLADLEKVERQRTEIREAVTSGNMSFGDALAIFRGRLLNDSSLKPRSKEFRQERIAALRNSWPGLEQTEVRKITKQDCLAWAADYSIKASPPCFNTCVATLRMVIDVAIEAGARYDNPARFIKKLRVRQKELQLPNREQFLKMVESIERVNRRFSRDCANLVRFLAYGGFRKSEAANITWADCDFGKKEIVVRGDPETGTKNWTIRRVPMIPDMFELLKRLRDERPDEPASQPVMRVRECQKTIDSACTILGIARFTHHDLRHLFATLCIESGVDIPTVSRWLGHKDGGALAMKVYGHLRDQHSVAMAQRVTFGGVSAVKNEENQ
ncbi:MAG: site-specific integrase [Smithellaceae bacterium]